MEKWRSEPKVSTHLQIFCELQIDLIYKRVIGPGNTYQDLKVWLGYTTILSRYTVIQVYVCIVQLWVWP